MRKNPNNGASKVRWRALLGLIVAAAVACSSAEGELTDASADGAGDAAHDGANGQDATSADSTVTDAPPEGQLADVTMGGDAAPDSGADSTWWQWPPVEGPDGEYPGCFLQLADATAFGCPSGQPSEWTCQVYYDDSGTKAFPSQQVQQNCAPKSAFNCGPPPDSGIFGCEDFCCK